VPLDLSFEGAEHDVMTELLERDESLASLAASHAAGGRLVFVGGEAGVGKTALVRAFAARARGRTLYGGCENLATPAPLAPFVDIAGQTGGAFAERLSVGADPRFVARGFLEQITASTSVILEDVHWVDQATLDALRVIGRRIDETEGLVLATYRDDEVERDHPLRVVLGELASEPGVSRLTVPRLSLDAVRELAEPSGADAVAIHGLTGGNAFYVTEVLASGAQTLPATVRDAVLARAATLARDGRRLLDLVALVPGAAEHWLLEAVAPESFEHVDECLASGMLREDGAAVAFRHELARLAIESTVPVRRRRALHAALLRGLGTPPAGQPDVSRLAHHAEEAGDTSAVLEHAATAARLASDSGAHLEAAAQYARVLRHAIGLPAASRAALLDAYAQEAQVTGSYAEAIEARQERRSPSTEHSGIAWRRVERCRDSRFRTSTQVGTRRPRQRAGLRSSCSRRSL